MHPEEVPLRVSIGAVVVLQVEIVLEVRYLDRLPEVSALEATLKDQRRIFRVPQLVVWLEVVVVSVQAWPLVLAWLLGSLLAGWHRLGAIAGRLLQTVRQIHGVEVVSFLVGLIDLARVLLVGGRQLDQVALINVEVVRRVAVVGRALHAIIDDR